MQTVFLDNWTKTTGTVLHGDNYFPELPEARNDAAQMFSSSPSGGSESMHLMYLLAITSAQHSIHLSSAYFVPDRLSSQALVDALKRGVSLLEWQQRPLSESLLEHAAPLAGAQL